jgi:alkylation response protein AidB-like acyl-CoA dehydrogenase
VDFDLTDEQKLYRQTVIEFATRELNHGVAGRDAREEFSRESWKKCADFGLTGLPVPVEYEGQGADALTIAIALEALGYGCRDSGLIFSLNAHMWSAAAPIARFGTAEQKERWLRGMCDGSVIGVQAMTEPGSGSDAFALSTTATGREDDFVLNGSKTFITNAPIADVFVVFATTDRSKGWAGLSAFLVEAGARGVSISEPFDKMGLRTSPMGEVTFDECRVPRANLLGRPGSGMVVFDYSIDWERSFILASAVGTMQRELEQCIAHAKARRQFGTHIGSFQAVAHRIVDMKVRLDAARMLVYRLAWLKAAGRPAKLESSIVKLYVAEGWLQSSLDQIQIHGAYGYMTEAGLERDVRDAVASRIYSGTSEIQRNLIAHHLGLSRPAA